MHDTWYVIPGTFLWYNFPVAKQTYRRWTGLILGALIALAFGGVSQVANPLLLPGIPLYQPPFGPIGNSLLALLMGALLGLLCAWVEPSIPGILMSAGTGATLALLVAMNIGRTPLFMLPATAIGIVFLWLPFTGMLFPVMALVRAMINKLTDSRNERLTLLERGWLPLLLVVAAGALGWTLVLTVPARTVMARNQQMMTAGLAAASTDELPAPLRGKDVADFRSNASQNYQLAWENKNLTVYAIPRPAGSEHEISVVIARFDNGWNVVCLYPNSQSEPRCRSFDELP